MRIVKYTDGYENVLEEGWFVHLPLFAGWATPIGDDTGANIVWIDNYACLYNDGLLCAQKGYAWDGVSGPGIGRALRMAGRRSEWTRAALAHDLLYQLSRDGVWAFNPGGYKEDFRLRADREFKRILLEDGATRIGAWLAYKAVRKLGHEAATQKREVKVAP